MDSPIHIPATFRICDKRVRIIAGPQQGQEGVIVDVDTLDEGGDIGLSTFYRVLLRNGNISTCRLSSLLIEV